MLPEILGRIAVWDVLFGTFHMPENRLPGLKRVSISPAEHSSKP